MGCNYYLKKKDESKWIVPNNKLGIQLEHLCTLVYLDNKKNNEREALALNLNQCVSEVDSLHIGKSSYGWYFDLCIYPTLGIYSLEDWITLFNKKDEYVIFNEDDEEVSVEEMLSTITERKAKSFDKYESVEDYEKHCIENTEFNTYDELLEFNSAYRGINGLLAHKSVIWDKRDEEMFKTFMPIITYHIPTNGTYDLTPDWDFS